MPELTDDAVEVPAPQLAEPAGSGEVVVRDGDCIASIAFERGLFWERVWNDPANANLRELRGDPNVLLPGDRVTVRLLEPKRVPAITGRRYTFRRRGVPERLRLELHDAQGQPIAGRPFTLVVDNVETTGTTTAEGEVEAWIAPNAAAGRVTIELDDTREDVRALRFGSLAPSASIHGALARLLSLGYLPPDFDDADISDPQVLEGALSTFQVVNGLDPTGVLDEDTHTLLARQHGS